MEDVGVEEERKVWKGEEGRSQTEEPGEGGREKERAALSVVIDALITNGRLDIACRLAISRVSPPISCRPPLVFSRAAWCSAIQL